MTPLLSILICSIPSRFEKALKLYGDILLMIGDKNIELLLFCDNWKRSIGAKREAMKNISNGKYFFFVDDDDSLYSVEEIYEACKSDVDVITFKVRCRNSDGSEYIVTVGLGNEIEHNSVNEKYVDLKRPPFLQAVWNSKFKDVHFADLMYGEDWEFVKQIDAKTEVHIDKVLQGYNFDPNTSEAVVTTPPPKRCVVNFANSQYQSGQRRLYDSMQGQNIPLLTWQFEASLNAPLHSDNPYAFKIYAIEEARKRGYDQILWVDASVYSVKDITPVFNWLTDKGIFLEEAGHYLGQWCHDAALNYFGIKREDAMKMPMLSAGFIGFDFRNPISQQFFAEWKESMLNGMFKGRWEDHRHDLTCASAIANLRGLVPLYSHGGQFFAYIGPGYGEPGPKVVFNLQGC